jgi:hypothetical protein
MVERCGIHHGGRSGESDVTEKPVLQSFIFFQRYISVEEGYEHSDIQQGDFNRSSLLNK